MPSASGFETPTPHYVFAPGHPDGPEANRYIDWERLYTAMQVDIRRTKEFGRRIIELDSRYAPAGFFGLPAVVFPAGEWDVTDIEFTNRRDENSFNITFVEPAEGCKFRSDTNLRFNADRMVWSFNAESGGPVFSGIVLVVVGGRIEFENSSEDAVPTFNCGAGADHPTPGNVVIDCSPGAFSSFGGNEEPQSPIIDLAGGSFLTFQAGASVSDKAVMDSVGGGQMPLNLYDDNAFADSNFGSAGPQYDWPDLAADSVVTTNTWARDRHKVRDIFEPEQDDDVYNATYNEVVRVDSSLFTSVVELPRARPVSGDRVVVKDVGSAASPPVVPGAGNAAMKNIAIRPVGGDKIDGSTGNVLINANAGSVVLVADGGDGTNPTPGNWMVIATK